MKPAQRARNFVKLPSTSLAKTMFSAEFSNANSFPLIYEQCSTKFCNFVYNVSTNLLMSLISHAYFISFHLLIKTVIESKQMSEI